VNAAGALSVVIAVALMQPPEIPLIPESPVVGGHSVDIGEERPDFVTDGVIDPDGGPSQTDLTARYRLLNAYQAQQGRQGILDGRWTVAGATGAEVFILQLTDPGAGEGRIEGAWRNLKVTGPKGSGFVDSVTRDGDFTVIRFFEGEETQPTEVRVRYVNDGWAGEALVKGAAGGSPIVMRRSGTLELAALGAPQVAPEPRPPAAKAKARPTPKRAKAKKSRPRAAPKRAGAKKK